MSQNNRSGGRAWLKDSQPSRNFDCVYDPNCILSGHKDHAKITMKAQADVKFIKCPPIFESMFSELVHHPRFGPRLEGVDHLPAFISREWQNYEAVARETLRHHEASADYETGHRLVAHRIKYLDRPVTPNICHKMPPSHFLSLVQFAPEHRVKPTTRSSGNIVSGESCQTVVGGATKNVGTQTVYRDGETQTMAYETSYTVTPGTRPEILNLAVLTSKRGLPAGLREIYLIERTRANRLLELTVPPEGGKNKWNVQRAILEAGEICRWIMREKEIEKLQEEKLKILIQVLKEKEQRTANSSKKHYEALWLRDLEKKTAERKKIVKIKHEFLRSIRKLNGAKKKKLQLHLKRREIGKEYTDFGSQVFAPLTRVGYFLDRCAEIYEVRNIYNSTYEGICELENSAKLCLFDVCIQNPQRNATTKTGYLRRKYRYEQMLIEMTEAINAKRRGSVEIALPISSYILQRYPRPAKRLATPKVTEISAEVEDKVLAVLALQAVLRGRRIQTVMLESLDRKHELINELRSIHTVQKEKKKIYQKANDAQIALMSMCKEAEHKDHLVGAELYKLDSESLAKMLDFLSKELIKLQEEQRLQALSLLIERQRRIREAEEAGQRQIEERRRREEDEIFKQTVKVHQRSIDTYLEDVILAAINRGADKQARSEVQQLAQSIDAIVHELEHRRTKLEADVIVAELVNSFLLPEVMKEISRQKIRVHQSGFLKAAHDQICRDSSNVSISEDNEIHELDKESDHSFASSNQETQEHEPNDQ